MDDTGKSLASGLWSSYYRFINDYRIDLTDPYTLRKLNHIYHQSRGINPVRGTEASLTHKRAATGELDTLILFSPRGERGGPQIRRLRFVPESKNERTPDIEVERTDGTKFYVEVRTLTQASRGIRVNAKIRGRQNQTLSLEEYFIKTKLFREQINAARPGTIVFHAPFGRANDGWLREWQDCLDGISQKMKGFPAGLECILVTTGSPGMMAFESRHEWKGYLI